MKKDRVDTINEVISNVIYLKNCLESNDEEERDFARKRIRSGIDFIAYPQEDGYIFGPARFLSYKDNNIKDFKKYRVARRGDGQVNNIFEIRFGLHFNKALKNEFEKFCDKFSINMQGINVDLKKYCLLRGTELSPNKSNESSNAGNIASLPKEISETLQPKKFSKEGRELLKLHKFIERVQGLRKELLADRRQKGIRCEICDWFPDAMENNMHESMFEAHHVIPLARGERVADISDLALLCACCHRLIHRVMGKNALDRLVGIKEMRDKYGKSLYCGKG